MTAGANSVRPIDARIRKAIADLGVRPSPGQFLLAFFPGFDSEGELMLLHNEEVRQYMAYVDKHEPDPVNLGQYTIQVLMDLKREVFMVALNMAAKGKLPCLSLTVTPEWSYIGLDGFTNCLDQ